MLETFYCVSTTTTAGYTFKSILEASLVCQAKKKKSSALKCTKMYKRCLMVGSKVIKLLCKKRKKEKKLQQFLGAQRWECGGKGSFQECRQCCSKLCNRGGGYAAPVSQHRCYHLPHPCAITHTHLSTAANHLAASGHKIQ